MNRGEPVLDAFHDRKILVVGGAGFVGSNLVAELLAGLPKEILVVDNLLSSEPQNVPPHPCVTFLKGSITSKSILASLDKDIDYVFHLATFHGNQNSMSDPLKDHENNALSTLKLYEGIRSMSGLKKVVYASAGCAAAKKTFDAPVETTEDSPVSLNQDTPYQISKIVGEFYSHYYFNQHRLPVVIARFQNVYGPGEMLGAGEWRGTSATIWRNVVPVFVYRGLRKRPLLVESAGKATRDFIYVGDIVEGLLRCAERGLPGETYNLASGVETSILDLASLINRVTENSSGIEFLPGREWDNSGRRLGSTRKSREQLGFEARTTLEDGIRETVGWTSRNMDRIAACIQKHRNHCKEEELF